MVIQFGLYGLIMSNMKKTVYVIILITFFAAMLQGCSNGKFINSEKIAKENCEDILKYLEDGDKEGLKNMFCNKISSSEELDKQIGEAIDFFEGKTSSYDAKTSSGGTSYRDGEIVRLKVSPSIEDIITDADKKYEIKFYLYIVCAEDKDKEGISEISITSDSGEECIIGEYIK